MSGLTKRKECTQVVIGSINKVSGIDLLIRKETRVRGHDNLFADMDLNTNPFPQSCLYPCWCPKTVVAFEEYGVPLGPNIVHHSENGTYVVVDVPEFLGGERLWGQKDRQLLLRHDFNAVVTGNNSRSSHSDSRVIRISNAVIKNLSRPKSGEFNIPDKDTGLVTNDNQILSLDSEGSQDARSGWFTQGPYVGAVVRGFGPKVVIAGYWLDTSLAVASLVEVHS